MNCQQNFRLHLHGCVFVWKRIDFDGFSPPVFAVYTVRETWVFWKWSAYGSAFESIASGLLLSEINVVFFQMKISPCLLKASASESLKSSWSFECHFDLDLLSKKNRYPFKSCFQYTVIHHEGQWQNLRELIWGSCRQVSIPTEKKWRNTTWQIAMENLWCIIIKRNQALFSGFVYYICTSLS